ncbi:hypothetical protein GALL_228470 [mine drainage metagenome]|uniref:PsbP C-terminal domain-containing protein n=1 Tax=mine drainage metagenome TaxID=410659 RepID=A0A1J5RGC2_9ZZZZ
MRYLVITISILFLLFSSVYSQKIDTTNNKRIDIGSLNSNNYRNNYFNFGIIIPNDWKVLNKEELVNTNNYKLEIIKSENGLTDEEIKSRMEKFVILLSTSKNPISLIPLIIFYTLDLDLDLTDYTETHYLNNYKNTVNKMYKSVGVEFSFSEIEEEYIDEKKFNSFVVTVKRSGLYAYQKVYSTKFGNKFLNILANYETEETKKETQDFLKGIKWGK